jgi:hypothetical protein
MERHQEGWMDREKISEAIQSAAVNGRLTCEKAHEISTKMNVALREIGTLCNELKIKIASCQLGCF